MEIRQITSAPLSANKRTMNFGYKLLDACCWRPFLNEIQSNAARRCVSNMDGDFFSKLTLDLNRLNTEKIDLTKIIEYAKYRIITGSNYDEKAMKEFNEKTKDMLSKIETPNAVDVLVSKPYWGMTKTEKVTGEIYEQNVTDSFIDFKIPETKKGYFGSIIFRHKLGTQKRFFCLENTAHDDDFYFARKKWSDLDNDKITPFGQMLADFNEALIKGFEDLYNGIVKKDEIPQVLTNKGAGSVPPFVNDTQFNNVARFWSFN